MISLSITSIVMIWMGDEMAMFAVVASILNVFAIAIAIKRGLKCGKVLKIEEQERGYLLWLEGEDRTFAVRDDVDKRERNIVSETKEGDFVEFLYYVNSWDNEILMFLLPTAALMRIRQQIHDDWCRNLNEHPKEWGNILSEMDEFNSNNDKFRNLGKWE